MGQCLPCMGDAVKDVVETPDPEIKRRQLAEAAEKRQMEASSRGIKNVHSVEQKKKKQEEIERRMAASRPGGEGGLRWQVG
ncbi:small VCP/p97-interacting protein [Molothrus aeneus]|uniref:small VCP/p97-interacting protein n=1 Tax=Molothrus ater TaxID=84834 RepID=UPI001748FA9F|nr:small VCP/p97-interacting protein [Molothrus ater]XP_054491395.1 small VCP/p97-interacting protein [Agelaius phoeniceus]